MTNKTQEKAKNFAFKHGYKLRKIKEGKVKVIRPDGSELIVHDFSSASTFMMSEVYKTTPNDNIFDFSKRN